MRKPDPALYRTTNWKSYCDALKRCGSLLVWLNRDMDWLAPKAVEPGRPPVFSDTAIQFCLTINVLFGLQFSQATGMVAASPSWLAWTARPWCKMDSGIAIRADQLIGLMWPA